MKVIIVGGGCTWLRYHDFLPCDQLWCLGFLYPQLKQATQVFEIHKDTNIWSEGSWMASADGKLITDVPPIEGHCYTSSFDYVLSYAIQNQATEIILCGVNLETPPEFSQREGLEYMLGFCRASGIKTFRTV